MADGRTRRGLHECCGTGPVLRLLGGAGRQLGLRQPGSQKQAAKAKVQKAKAKKASTRRALKNARQFQASSQRELDACLASPTPTATVSPTTSPTTSPSTPVSPIQALCDAGTPQAVCDAFLLIPLPEGGGTGAGPIQPLCDAGLPQTVCPMASGGIPGLPGLPLP